MQPSATAPRAKTAASLSFQAASPLVANLACKDSWELKDVLERRATCRKF